MPSVTWANTAVDFTGYVVLVSEIVINSYHNTCVKSLFVRTSSTIPQGTVSFLKPTCSGCRLVWIKYRRSCFFRFDQCFHFWRPEYTSGLIIPAKKTNRLEFWIARTTINSASQFANSNLPNASLTYERNFGPDCWELLLGQVPQMNIMISRPR